MQSGYKMLAYIMAANVEAITLFIGGDYLSVWLDQEYKQEYPWSQVVFPVVMLLLLISWTRMIFSLVREAKENSKD